MTKPVLFLRIICFVAVLLLPPRDAIGQEQANNQVDTPAAGTVAGSPGESVNDQPATTEAESTEPSNEVFQLPGQHHAWARYQPGAWRKVQTVTTALDEDGNVTSRNMSTQTETLEAVAEGKYVLKVQATVELGGKQIVGEEKTRVLHLETDGAGTVSASRRLEDQPAVIAGRRVDSQLWEVSYQQAGQNLLDRVSYSDAVFPHVLRRVTYLDQGSAESVGEDAEDEVADPQDKTPTETVKEDSELIALAMPCPDATGRTRFCACVRTIRYRQKGNTVRLVFRNPDVPGGEISVGSTDFDADGDPVRISTSSLLDFGGEVVETAIQSAEAPPEP